MFYCLLNTSIVKFLKPKLSKVLRFMANTHCHYSERALKKSPLYLFHSCVIQVCNEKGHTFFPHLEVSYCIYSSSGTCNSTASSTHRDSWIFSPHPPKKNLAIAQKMALVNTKIKHPDDEPDCTQAFRLARRKGKKNPPKRRSFPGSHSQSKLQ